MSDDGNGVVEKKRGRGTAKSESKVKVNHGIKRFILSFFHIVISKLCNYFYRMLPRKQRREKQKQSPQLRRMRAVLPKGEGAGQRDQQKKELLRHPKPQRQR